MGYHRLRCDDLKRKNNTSTTVVVTDIVRCGGLKREQWIDNRMSELLPTPYYHLVLPCARIKSADYSQPKSVVQTPLMPLPKPLSADAHI
jgi:hypothetical protein